MKKLFEVLDEQGHPTMIPFHRVIRVVKATSRVTFMPAVLFEMDGGATIAIPEKEGESAWSAYRQWVESL